MDSSEISKNESEDSITVHIPDLHLKSTEFGPQTLGMCPADVHLKMRIQ